MNVSMMDSYNLAWKLAHTIHGLTPNKLNGSVLATFNSERLGIARMLIDFDTKFSSMFSGQIEPEGAAKGLTHEQFLKVFSDGSGFTSGCGIEYSPSTVVQDTTAQSSSPIIASNYLQGTLRPGRRLLDSVVRRYADANLRHLQDGMCYSSFPRSLVVLEHSDGRFRFPLERPISHSCIFCKGPAITNQYLLTSYRKTFR